MAKGNLQSHERADKLKWIATLVAFVLLFAAVAALVASLFVGSDWITTTTFRFEAENMLFSGSSIVLDTDTLESEFELDFDLSGDACVFLSEGDSATFTFTSSREAEAVFSIAGLFDAEPGIPFYEVFTLWLNGEQVNVRRSVNLYMDYMDSCTLIEIVTLNLVEGENMLVLEFGLDFEAVAIDYFELEVLKGVKLKAIEPDEGKIPHTFRGTWVGEIEQISGTKSYAITIGEDDILVKRDTVQWEAFEVDVALFTITFEDEDDNLYTLILNAGNATMTFKCDFYDIDGTLTRA